MIRKITNPHYLGVIAPMILSFYKRVKDTSGMYDGIRYETLFAYLTKFVQMGRGTPEDKAEVWVAYNEDETPVGFAAWHVMDLPHIGKVFCPILYNDTKTQGYIKELYEEFIQFGRRHRSPIYQYTAVNKKVGDYFQKVLAKLGVESKETGGIEYIGRES